MADWMSGARKTQANCLNSPDGVLTVRATLRRIEKPGLAGPNIAWASLSFLKARDLAAAALTPSSRSWSPIHVRPPENFIRMGMTMRT